MKSPLNHIYFITLFVGGIMLSSGCESFVEVDPPITTTNAANVYSNATNAIAVLTGIYSTMSVDENNNKGFGALNSLSGLSADELTLLEGYDNDNYVPAYYKNELRSEYDGEIWLKIYNLVYTANSALEGVDKSQKLPNGVKVRLLGEAHFVRALCYFTLINLYGDVPLVTTTDYKINAAKPRTSVIEVYAQIKDDLIKAQSMLSEGYLDGALHNSNDQRVRPNKYAAHALLARFYLYTKDWANAETQSSQVIDNLALYEPVPLEDVFLMNSRETIWALQATGTGMGDNTGAGKLFVLPETGPNLTNYVYLNEDLIKSFDPIDKRLTNWIGNVSVAGVPYFFANKYKIGEADAPVQEYPILLRIGEQFLIRAEARAMQNKLIGDNSAQSDIDVIRTRAGLTGTTATSQADLLTAILDERRHELFTEYGHRWFDLRRTNTIDAVMTPATAKKGGIWKSSSALYPIPLHEIQNNPKLTQNPDYN